MNKKIIGIFICILLICTVLPVTADLIVEKTNNSKMLGKTLYVGGSGPNNYTNIQDAIDNASDGDTIFVYTGDYDLIFSISIDISIRLIGENKYNTILNGGGIIINTSKVEIRNFTFLNSYAIMTMPFFEDFTISNNIFKQEEFNALGWIGIGSNYSTISDNSFFNCGLMLLFSYHNSIYNNTINGKPLVYLEDVANELIDYPCGQVILVHCNNITIENLELSYTLFGIELIDTINCLILNNNLSKNYVAGFFVNSNNNIISGNIFSDNIVGLAFTNSKDNNISKNSFKNNQFSIFFMYSSNNLISYNNFKYSYNFYIGHNRNILSSGSDNTWIGNFWNRPRFLPVLIWNFKIIHLRFLLFLPTSPDVDWHPAKKLNDI